MASPAESAAPIGLLAGNGSFPVLFARAARARGLKVAAIGHLGDTDASMKSLVDAWEWVHIGQVGRSIAWFKGQGVRQVVMAGGIGKLAAIARARPDWLGLQLASRIRSLNDDVILRTIAEAYAAEGLEIASSTLFTPELLVPAGHLCGPAIDDVALQDVAFGFRIAGVVGAADVGQTVVVEGRRVLAVEASEGTDPTIVRGGGYGSGRAVVVKRSKPGQDLRFDLPAVGPRTIQRMKESGCRVLALETGRALLLEGEATLRAADAAGITVLAVDDSTLPAELTPGVAK